MTAIEEDKQVKNPLTPLPLDLTTTTAPLPNNTTLIQSALPQLPIPTNLLNTSTNVFLSPPVGLNSLLLATLRDGTLTTTVDKAAPPSLLKRSMLLVLAATQAKYQEVPSTSRLTFKHQLLPALPKLEKPDKIQVV